MSSCVTGEFLTGSGFRCFWMFFDLLGWFWDVFFGFFFVVYGV